MGNSLPGAIGATKLDQEKIDDTVAGGCGAKVYTQAECIKHTEAVKAAHKVNTATKGIPTS